MTGLTSSSPFAARFHAYLRERFPLVRHGILIVSYYSSNQFLAQALSNPGAPVSYNPWTLAGALALLCVFFHLRICDEHKDYEDDVRNYPERILQSGVITLRELRVIGLLAVACEILIGAWRGVHALVAVGVVVAFSLLMLKEFFLRDWLRRHFLVYAVSHMLIMPLIALMVFSFTLNQPFWTAPGMFMLYAWVGFFVTFNWEISRKIRAPEQERDGIDTYTRIFGTYGAGWVVILVRVVDTALVAVVGWHLALPVWFYAVLSLLFLVCLGGFLHYRFHTTPKTAAHMEVYAGMYIIAFDLTLACALVAKNGYAW